MSKESFDDDFYASEAGNNWLYEWEAEQKLSPDGAHEMLRVRFAERLAEWRRDHPDENSWVIPFCYTHEDDDELNFRGALWIPPEHVQNVINKFGSYIHMSAMIEMENELFGTGINTNHQPPSIMDLSGEEPSVYVNPLFSMVLRQSEEIERDFGVAIRTM